MTDLIIDFGKRKQGSTPVFQFTWPMLAGDSSDDLTDYVLSATMRNKDSLAVTAVTGAITVVDGELRLCQWEMSAADLGMAGTFGVTLTGTDGSSTLKTLYGSLVVEDDPAITAVANPPIVGVSQDDADWLAAQPQVAGFFMQRTVVEADETVTIPANHQMIVAGDLTIDGAVISDGDLIII